MQKYKINAPHVIHEIIEGEAILVNLKSGNYYSFDNSGLVIWEVLFKTGIGDLLNSTIAAVYTIDEKEIKMDIEKFVKKLIQEKLIVPDTEDTDKPTDEFLNQLIRDYRLANTQYKSPLLHIYADMQDMLLLDPIHDTDEKGWPSIDDN